MVLMPLTCSCGQICDLVGNQLSRTHDGPGCAGVICVANVRLPFTLDSQREAGFTLAGEDRSEDYEPHGGVVADRRDRGAGVEKNLWKPNIVGYRLGQCSPWRMPPMLYKAPRANNSTMASTPTLCRIVPDVPHRHLTQQQVQRLPHLARCRWPTHLQQDLGQCAVPYGPQHHSPCLGRHGQQCEWDVAARDEHEDHRMAQPAASISGWSRISSGRGV